MVRPITLTFLILFLTSKADAELFSVRCTDPAARTPVFSKYFATFETELNRVVFQAVSGPAYPGTIRRSDDETIAFSVHGDGGDFELTWDRHKNLLTWAGIAGDALRPLLIHPCKIIETKSVVSGFEDRPTAAADAVGPFSLRCRGDRGPVYFTFDPRTHKALMEGYSSSSYYYGKIDEIDSRGAVFSVDIGQGPGNDLKGMWARRERTLTLTGYSDDPARSITTECTEIAVRSIMHLYCSWPGRRIPALCN